MVTREEPYCILARQNTFSILLTSAATPRDVYKAFTQCYLGKDDVEAILTNMVLAGWDLDTLALNTHGYRIQIEK